MDAERDKLTAELERVKAERDALKADFDACIHHKNQTIEEFSGELESLLSRLPKNEKGERIFFGDEVWWIGPYSHTEPVSFTVASIVYSKDTESWRFNGGDDKVYLSSESCRAARQAMR